MSCHAQTQNGNQTQETTQVQQTDRLPEPHDETVSPPSPTIQLVNSGTRFPAGSPSDLIVIHDNIYVLNSWSRGDSAFRLGNHTLPILDSIPVMGYMFQGTVQNNYLYIANWFSMVVVDTGEEFRASTWVTRQMLFHFPAGDIHTIASSPDRVYLGGRKHGMRIFDITTPGKPVLITWLPDLGGIRSIAASPSRVVIRPMSGDAYIATPSPDESTGIDINARLPLKGEVTLIDQTLYESTGKAINIYDLKNAAQPRLVSTLPYERVIADPFENQVLFAKDKSTLVVMDITSPQSPKAMQELPLEKPLPVGNYVFKGDSFYVLDKVHALVEVFNLPENTAKLTYSISPDEQMPLMRNGGTVEIIEPVSPWAGERANPYYLKAYVQRDQISLITTGFRNKWGIWTGQILQQDMTKRSGFRHYSQQWASAMVRLGPYVLLGDGVVDVTDIKKPKAIVPTTRPAANIFLDRHLAYLAQGDRMTMLDLTAMPKPVTLGQYIAKDKKQVIVDVTAQGKTAHVLSRINGGSLLEVLDVTTAAMPTKVAQLELPTSIAMTRHGAYLYIPSVKQSNANPVLNIVDVSTPDQPKIVATIKDLLRGDSYRLKVDQNTLYVADDDAGILALDLADPVNPILTTVYRGNDTHLQIYTDFVILGRTLYALRYAQIDQWPLPGHQE